MVLFQTILSESEQLSFSSLMNIDGEFSDLSLTIKDQSKKELDFWDNDVFLQGDLYMFAVSGDVSYLIQEDAMDSDTLDVLISLRNELIEMYVVGCKTGMIDIKNLI